MKVFIKAYLCVSVLAFVTFSVFYAASFGVLWGLAAFCAASLLYALHCNLVVNLDKEPKKENGNIIKYLRNQIKHLQKKLKNAAAEKEKIKTSIRNRKIAQIFITDSVDEQILKCEECDREERIHFCKKCDTNIQCKDYFKESKKCSNKNCGHVLTKIS